MAMFFEITLFFDSPCTQYLHNIYTVQYLHSIYTLRPPDGHDGGVVVVLHLEVLYLGLEVCLLQHAALHPVQLARSAPGRAQREPAPAGAELPTKLREVSQHCPVEASTRATSPC